MPGSDAAIAAPPAGFVPEEQAGETTPPPGFVPEGNADPQAPIKQKYGLPPEADISKPFFDEANKALEPKHAQNFSKAYAEFNPGKKPENSPGWEGAMAPRNAEEVVSGAEMAAGEGAGSVAWNGFRRLAPELADTLESGASAVGNWLKKSSSPMEDIPKGPSVPIKDSPYYNAEAYETARTGKMDAVPIKNSPYYNEEQWRAERAGRVVNENPKGPNVPLSESPYANKGKIGVPGSPEQERGYYPSVTKVPIRPEPSYKLTPESVPGPDTAGKGNLLSPLAKKGDPRAAQELMRRGRNVLYVPAEEYPPARETTGFDASGSPYAKPKEGEPPTPSGITKAAPVAVPAAQVAATEAKNSPPQKTRPGPTAPSEAGATPAAASEYKGMVKQGNIDVNHRPTIKNADGSHSTIYSVTVPIEDGKWVVIPSIVDGKFLTSDGKMPKRGSKDDKALEDKAFEHYKTSGEHLGIFDSLKAADNFTSKTHAYMPDGTDRKVYLPPPTQNK